MPREPLCGRRSGSLPRPCAPNFAVANVALCSLRCGVRSRAWPCGRIWYSASVSRSRLAPSPIIRESDQDLQEVEAAKEFAAKAEAYSEARCGRQRPQFVLLSDTL